MACLVLKCLALIIRLWGTKNNSVTVRSLGENFTEIYIYKFIYINNTYKFTHINLYTYKFIYITDEYHKLLTMLTLYIAFIVQL